MSDLQGRRIPGEERSGRRRPLLWILLGLLLLLLLAVLIPFACQAMNGGSNQGGGSGAQGGAEQEANGDAQDEGAAGGTQNDQAQNDEAQNGEAQGGSGEQAGSDEQAGSGGAQEVATARLSARDQSGDGDTVTVPAATVEGTRGWVAVRADDGGEPGEVLGRAPLREGENSGVEVELRRPLDSSQQLYTTVHAERPADGDFTYPDGDPTLERGGQVVAEQISYQIEGSGKTAQGGIDDELPESGGVPPAVLMAAAAMLLASGAWGVRAALR